MNAIEKLQRLAEKVEEQKKIVMDECCNLHAAASLMLRHGMHHIVEAVAIEAKQRVLPAQWAEVTK
jgi:hypothetical protein